MNRVVHFEIQADQPERAAKFYRDVFGWEIKKWEGGTMEYWMVMTIRRVAEKSVTMPQIPPPIRPWRIPTASGVGWRLGGGYVEVINVQVRKIRVPL